MHSKWAAAVREAETKAAVQARTDEQVVEQQVQRLREQLRVRFEDGFRPLLQRARDELAQYPLNAALRTLLLALALLLNLRALDRRHGDQPRGRAAAARG